MRLIPFSWSGLRPLLEELQRPIENASVQILQERWPISLTFWRSSTDGLRIRAVTNNLSERFEAGSLAFDQVQRINETEIKCDVCDQLSSSQLWKLVVREGGCEIEAGIRVQTEKPGGIMIVAGVYPQTLAIKGIRGLSTPYEPEYEVESYTKRPF